jgi:hypothetical protein
MQKQLTHTGGREEVRVGPGGLTLHGGFHGRLAPRFLFKCNPLLHCPFPGTPACHLLTLTMLLSQCL